ncbi:MAG: hypothetical protein ACI88A_001422 [Paraglaciecola sp.]|jgi:hypothetical protein
MKNIVKSAIVGFTTVMCFPALAGITVIDFDNDSANVSIINGKIVDDQYAGDGVTITSVVFDGSNTDIENIQIAFDTSHNSIQDNDLEFGVGNAYDGNGQYGYTALNIGDYVGGPTPGNVLILQNADYQNGCSSGMCDTPNDEAGHPAGYFEFSFDFLVDILSIDTFDFEESSLLTAQFFDVNNDEISTSYVFSAMINGGFVRQDIGITGVKRLQLNLPGSGAIDNLVFEKTLVPAPGSFVMFSLALLFMLRRARK